MSTTKSMTTDLPADSYDADELGQYRSLSTMAVLAFVLGVCSILMFATPLMVVVPLAAAAAALLALRSIAASGGGLTGARLARVGLALAILFGVGALTRVKVRQTLLVRQVDRVCQQWLNIASEGKVEEMLELMTKSAGDKLMPAGGVGDPGSFFGGMLSSALMRQDPLVLTFSKLAEHGEINYVLLEKLVFTSTKPMQAIVTYSVSASGAEDISCSISLKRPKVSLDKHAWLIDSWTLD